MKKSIKFYLFAIILVLFPVGIVGFGYTVDFPSLLNVKNGGFCVSNRNCKSKNCTNYICCEKGKICCRSDKKCPTGQECSQKEKFYCEVPRVTPRDSGRTCDRDSRNICAAIVIDDRYYSITDSQLDVFKATLDTKMREKTGFGVTFLSTDHVRLSVEERLDHNQQGINYKMRHRDNLAEWVIMFIPTPQGLRSGGHSSWIQNNEDRSSYCNRFPSDYPPDGVEVRKMIYSVVVDWGHGYAVCGYHGGDGSVSAGGECSGRDGIPCIYYEISGYNVCGDADMSLPYYNPMYFRSAISIHELLHYFGSEGSEDHYSSNSCDERTGYDSYRELGEAGALRQGQENCQMCPDLFDELRESFNPDDCSS